MGLFIEGQAAMGRGPGGDLEGRPARRRTVGERGSGQGIPRGKMMWNLE
jgi:hypothetical protein